MADKNFTEQKARTLYAQLVKIANDMVDVAAAPAPQDGAGSAGPQEVVDALEVVIEELEAVSEAIPAEPTNGAPEEEAPVEAPVEEPVEEPEEPKLAKANERIASLEKELDSINREKVATRYAELFDDSKVQQAKYDEVLSSNDSLSTWTAKIESIEQYKQNEGASSYRPAKTTSSWIQSRSKVAKLAESEMMSL